MNCCKEENKQVATTDSTQGTHEKPAHKGHLSHMLMMVLCCGLPLAILALVPTLASLNPAFAATVGKFAPLLCPILMVPMVIMMFRGHKEKKD